MAHFSLKNIYVLIDLNRLYIEVQKCFKVPSNEKFSPGGWPKES